MRSGPVYFGVILILIIKLFFSSYEFFGILLVGFMIGCMIRKIKSGMWNAAKAGAIGCLIAAIIFLLYFKVIGTAMLPLVGGLSGFTISGFDSYIQIFENIIYYGIVTGIAGAVGGAVNRKKVVK